MLGNGQINFKRVLRHLLFWTAYIGYQTLQTGWENIDVFSFQLPHGLLTSLPTDIVIVYINLYVLMPRYYYKQKYVPFVIGLVALLFIDGFLNRYFAWAIWVPYHKIHQPAAYLLENKNFYIPVRILRNAFATIPVIAATILVKLMDNSFKQEKQLREIEKERYSAELGLLKAQINPHFLFNTLNSLYALTLKGSKQASKVVLRLSDLMHYMLYETAANKVLLEDEIKYIENYIAVEEMRFGERMEISFQFSGDINGKLIAPLLLLPFVENAFKHGIEHNSGWITINLNVLGSRLFLKVENSCAIISKPKDKGMGLQNVKRRLELIYPRKYELSAGHAKDVFEVDLRLDL